MALYSFIGVAVTSATKVIYGQLIWDPVEVLSRFRNPFVLPIGMVSLCLATLATNIAANVVSPANDFAHLWPRRISFKTGGLITGVVGILMQPWKLYADPTGYIFRWLVAYSALLGADRRHLDHGLLSPAANAARPEGSLPKQADNTGTREDSTPWRSSPWSPGIAPCVPGFLGTIGAARGRALLDFALSLRLVPELRDLGDLLRRADEARWRVARGCPSFGHRRLPAASLQLFPVFHTGS